MKERVVLGGGCFWCVEAVFSRVKGIEALSSAYCGGARANPTYESICTGVSGHAEVVDIEFDNHIISLREILEIFFATHNPTTLNQQGADKGTQYRSVIYYENSTQKEIIDASIIEAQQHFDSKIVTEVTPREEVYIAENYHQNYFALNPQNGYCEVVIAPKVAKFTQSYSNYLLQ